MSSKKRGEATPAQSPNFSPRNGKKNSPASNRALTVAVTDFLAALNLTRSERVFGALALALAEGMDDAPGYAKAKFGRELREVLARLEQAEVSPKNLALLKGIEV